MTTVTDRDRPVLTGLLALVAVAVVVGVVLGVATLLGTRVLGLGEASGSTGQATDADTLFLPPPSPTDPPSGPLVTLAPDGGPTQVVEAPTAEPSPTESESPEAGEISLSAGQTSVSPMGQIDLTGTYPGGEGAILQVQRFEGGSWSDFPVTVSVSGSTFATYVQTGRVGEARFRVVDTDSGVESNEVTVRVG
ncbi:hypothetical protein [Nocardioides perillae]|uniref:Uncharacterized protein n=1 Tax=Nocardioides perillae TaxID=1119534 RepID=A0A7Y9RUT0_9ACTN|nr:hypothetical protein [Nocardioides perillae]NYG54504.1 hypothetical protein [Nocardioides perillae]